MAVADDLDAVADLCHTAAKRTRALLLGLGPRPDDPAAALLWDQQSTRLQGQLNSLTAQVSRLTAAAVVAGLEDFAEPLATIGDVSRDAEERIREIAEVSELLTKAAIILDLGLAILAASAAPSPATLTAVVDAGEAVAEVV